MFFFFFLKFFYYIIIILFLLTGYVYVYMTPEASLTGGDVLGQPQNFSRNHYLMGLV